MSEKEFLEKNKCANLSCLHFKDNGYIYCKCCLFGACKSFTKEQKEIFNSITKEQSTTE